MNQTSDPDSSDGQRRSEQTPSADKSSPKDKIRLSKSSSSDGDLENFAPLPVSPLDQPFFLLFTVAFIFFVVVWIYVIPGFVAWRDGVLTSSDIAKHLTGKAAIV